MNDLFTYELVNFLPFSAEVYERLFTRINEAAWPGHLVALLAVVAIISGLRAQRARLVAWVTAVIWLWVGWFFFVEHFASLLWAAPYIGALFVVQAVVFGVMGWRRLEVESRASAVVFALAVTVWPLWYPLFGRPWSGVDLFAIAPDATAIGTLALLSSFGRRAWPLMIVPLAWCVISAATLWAMEIPAGIMTVVIGASLSGWSVLRNKQVV